MPPPDEEEVVYGLECRICLQKYNSHANRPSVNGCGHTICLSCNKVVPRCPICNVGRIAPFNINYGMEELLQEYGKKSKKIKELIKDIKNLKRQRNKYKVGGRLYNKNMHCINCKLAMLKEHAFRCIDCQLDKEKEDAEDEEYIQAAFCGGCIREHENLKHKIMVYGNWKFRLQQMKDRNYIDRIGGRIIREFDSTMRGQLEKIKTDLHQTIFAINTAIQYIQRPQANHTEGQYNFLNSRLRSSIDLIQKRSVPRLTDALDEINKCCEYAKKNAEQITRGGFIEPTPEYIQDLMDEVNPHEFEHEGGEGQAEEAEDSENGSDDEEEEGEEEEEEDEADDVQVVEQGNIANQIPQQQQMAMYQNGVFQNLLQRVGNYPNWVNNDVNIMMNHIPQAMAQPVPFNFGLNHQPMAFFDFQGAIAQQQANAQAQALVQQEDDNDENDNEEEEDDNADEPAVQPLEGGPVNGRGNAAGNLMGQQAQNPNQFRRQEAGPMDDPHRAALLRQLAGLGQVAIQQMPPDFAQIAGYVVPFELAIQRENQANQRAMHMRQFEEENDRIMRQADARIAEIDRQLQIANEILQQAPGANRNNENRAVQPAADVNANQPAPAGENGANRNQVVAAERAVQPAVPRVVQAPAQAALGHQVRVQQAQVAAALQQAAFQQALAAERQPAQQGQAVAVQQAQVARPIQVAAVARLAQQAQAAAQLARVAFAQPAQQAQGAAQPAQQIQAAVAAQQIQVAAVAQQARVAQQIHDALAAQQAQVVVVAQQAQAAAAQQARVGQQIQGAQPAQLVAEQPAVRPAQLVEQPVPQNGIQPPAPVIVQIPANVDEQVAARAVENQREEQLDPAQQAIAQVEQQPAAEEGAVEPAQQPAQPGPARAARLVYRLIPAAKEDIARAAQQRPGQAAPAINGNQQPAELPANQAADNNEVQLVAHIQRDQAGPNRPEEVNHNADDDNDGDDDNEIQILAHRQAAPPAAGPARIQPDQVPAGPAAVANIMARDQINANAAALLAVNAAAGDAEQNVEGPPEVDREDPGVQLTPKPRKAPRSPSERAKAKKLAKKIAEKPVVKTKKSKKTNKTKNQAGPSNAKPVKAEPSRAGKTKKLSVKNGKKRPADEDDFTQPKNHKMPRLVGGEFRVTRSAKGSSKAK